MKLFGIALALIAGGALACPADDVKDQADAQNKATVEAKAPVRATTPSKAVASKKSQTTKVVDKSATEAAAPKPSL